MLIYFVLFTQGNLGKKSSPAWGFSVMLPRLAMTPLYSP